ncbi:hypothetical protein K8I28_15745 [bacterium]|nr:hypothetical protein [bacterium]
MAKVLILGEDTRSFLSVVRSLGRKGIEVHAAWGNEGSPELHSRYIKKYHSIRRFDQKDDSWKDELVALLEKESYDLVIPTNDPAILPLQANREVFEPFAKIYFLDKKASEIGFNKDKANALARHLNIPIAEEIQVSSLDQAEQIREKFAFPVVLKPQASFSIDKIGSKHFVRKAYNEQELHDYLEQMLKFGSVTVQENVLGIGTGVELLAKNGKILTAFQHERVHEPLMGGGSSYRKSVRLHRGMLDASRKFIQAIDYTGVAMVEFKFDPSSGRWIFIEINARFWGSLPLAVAAGVDFPFYLYQMLVEQRANFPKRYHIDLYCRNLLNDLRWQWQNLKADKKDSTLATLPLTKIALEAKNILLLRERNDTLVQDDPLPAIMELKEFVRMVQVGMQLLNLKMLNYPLFREKYVLHVQERLRWARNILFVCKGNICRSPFAEGYAEKIFEGRKKIRSAGYFPKDGRKSPYEASQAAKLSGVVLEDHRSVILTKEMIDWADLIFVFDEENRLEVLKLYPTARTKLVRIGLLTNQDKPVIRDPFNGNLTLFTHTYQLIKDAIDLAARR